MSGAIPLHPLLFAIMPCMGTVFEHICINLILLTCKLKKKLKKKSVSVVDKRSGKIILILFNSEYVVLIHHTFLAISPTKMSTDRKIIS
jgi:hypothetical protein